MNSRAVSGIIAIIYLAVVGLSADGETMFLAGNFLILPLACIWYGKAIGGYTGMGMGRGAITTKTPESVIVVAGWILLVVPGIFGLLGALFGSK